MTTDRWQMIKEIFHASLERGHDQRSSFLNEACRGDDSLRHEVELLIAAHEKEGEFIDSPAYEVGAAWLGDAKGSLLVGQQINHYRILATLGVGGMGEVYLAQDTKLGRKIALKLLPAAFTKDVDRLHRFQQEARTASALNHPNILTIYEIGEEQGKHYIATELIEGQTLRERLADSRVELPFVLDIISQLASALAKAHEVGIVHRDIKPENIMVNSDGYVKVLDFGLAKLSESKARPRDLEAPTLMHGNTLPGTVMGTVNYMSPEQARGLDVDERTDIWSLGVVLYEMLAGTPPFKGATPTDVTVAILEREPAALASLSDEIPAELDWVVKKALRKDRDERYQTAKEISGDLRQLKQELEYATKLERTASGDSGAVRQASRSKDIHPVVHAATNKTLVIPTDEIREVRAATSDVQVGRTRNWRPPLIAAAVVIALAALGFALFKLFLQRKAFAPFQVSEIKRLTNHGKAILAAISPDGKYFAYALSDAGRQALYIRQTNATNDTEVVPPAPVGFFGVTFSRDGTQLYYVIKANDPGTLYRIPALGGTPVKLLENLDSAVSLSPDGKRVTFLRSDFPNRGESSIMIANADGTGERAIATRRLPQLFSPIPYAGPSWSPTGDLIATAMTDTKSDGRIAVVSVESGREEILSAQIWRSIARVEWLPDMSGLLTVAREQNSTGLQIWQVSYPQGEARKVTNDLNSYRELSLAADATRLLSIQISGLINIWVISDPNSPEAVNPQNGDNAPTSTIANSTPISSANIGFLGGDEGISWTPDNKIVFISASGRQGDIWIMNADASNRKQLTFDAGNNHNCVVSPDGRFVVFTSTRSGNRNVWRMNIDGSDPKKLTDGLVDLQPSFTPDGQWVVYSSLESGVLTLWKVPFNGGTPARILDRGANNAVVSPDARQIAYLYTDGPAQGPPNKIAIIPFEGGDPQKTFEVPRAAGGTRTIIKWSRDGRSLFYTAVANNASNIWRLPLDGGKPVQVTNFTEHIIPAFDWSRDGRRLAVSRGVLIRDVVLISNSK